MQKYEGHGHCAGLEMDFKMSGDIVIGNGNSAVTKSKVPKCF